MIINPIAHPIVAPIVSAIGNGTGSGAPAPAFSPLSLFAGGENGAWYDPSDLTTLWQDAAGTVPVTANLDPVRRMDDKSGNGNNAIAPSDAARPLYRTDGQSHWLEYDGVDDTMETGVSDAALTHYDAIPTVGVWMLDEIPTAGYVLPKFLGGGFPHPENLFSSSSGTVLIDRALTTGEKASLKSYYLAKSENSTGLVTTLDRMFGYINGTGTALPHFNYPIGDWNTSSVTSFAYTFYGAYDFNQPIDAWDMSAATSAYAMFYYAYSFNQPLDSWDVSGVSSMAYMFASATSFNQDLSMWSVALIPVAPQDFDTGATAWVLPNSRPDWGNP
jgi:hypothetical protein